MLAILMQTLFSPNLILVLSLHLCYVSSCYVSSHCSKSVKLRNKIFNIFVSKRYLHAEVIIYLVPESKRSWFLIILSSRYLMGVDKVLRMFGMFFLWNILCSFKCVYCCLEHRTNNAKVVSKICWKLNLSLFKILVFFLIIFLQAEFAKVRLHRNKA